MSDRKPNGPLSDENASGASTRGDSSGAKPAERELPPNRASAEQSDYRRGFFFWSLAPFLIFFLVVMAICTDKDTGEKVVVLGALETAVLSLLLGLWNPHRFWWAWRVLGAIVFLTFVAYVAAMAIEGRIGTGRRSEPSLINAILGLVVFGVPGLWYAFFGRLSWARESTDFDNDSLNDGESP
jgi:hypothetical protein